ncbi:Sortilin-related receptor [Toxocara canis]|uniref:Sortilin-related receptor n=1 Tax=Toxocara canis TaxID=6265 RepID=A0A0B2V8T5_TOXCA|nr:Sortilin-related receptor [Toxocara canis]
MLAASTLFLLSLHLVISLSVRDEVALPRCRSMDEFRCDLGVHCIPKAWLCDGRNDCVDGSDEHYCLHKNILPFVESQGKYRVATLKCPSTWFFCRDASKCVHPADVCNGIRDCMDGSDEEDFCALLKQMQRSKGESYEE